MKLPKDWVTGHMPHDVQIVKVGLFGRTPVVCCSCGLTGMGRKVNMWQLHEQNEMQMRAWLKSVYAQNSKPNNSYFK